MADYPTDYVSDLLSPQELRIAIEALPPLFSTVLGDAFITASYGWGCQLHFDLLYRDMKVGTKWFERFIRDSLRQEIVVPEDSDFRIAIPSQALEIVFCHEGHVHIGGHDGDLLNELLAKEPFASLRPGGSHVVPEAK